MADYAIGDIQGCYPSLMALLEHIDFDPCVDRLWCVGDLVNRGKHSLAVLRFLSQLKPAPIITLGNHDLYFLARLFTQSAWMERDDTLSPLLEAPDALSLGHWLRKQPLIVHDTALNCTMSHAGIPPLWTLDETCVRAREVEAVLRSDAFEGFLMQLFGNEPRYWSDTLDGYDRLRCIVNFLTRMRFCDEQGGLCLDYKGNLAGAPEGYFPWYAHPMRKPIKPALLFGHWAALGELQPAKACYALDTGCVWGNALSALRLQDRQLFQIEAQG